MIINKRLKKKSNIKKYQLLWYCGLGKTFMALFISYYLKSKKILIGVPSIYLQHQFYKSIKDIFNIEATNNYIEKEILIIVTTYHSSQKLIDNLPKNFTFDIKIADEAHHLVTSQKEKTNNN